MDTVDRKVAAIIYAGARRAYDYTPDDERTYPPACPHCGGDGCRACDWTGDHHG